MPRIVSLRNLLPKREATPRSTGWVEPQNEITRALGGSSIRPPIHSHASAPDEPGVEIFAKDTLGVDRPGYSHPERH